LMSVAFAVLKLFAVKLSIYDFIAGTLLGLCNFYLIIWAWSRIFIKKRIALASGVIVIKYLIVITVLFYLVNNSKTHLISLIIGLFSLVFVTVFYSVLMTKNTNSRNL